MAHQHNYNLPGIGDVNVSDIASLRALDPASYSRAFLLGFAEAGDGGEGLFVAVSGAEPGTYTHNGGTILAPAGSDGSKAWLRVVEGTYTPEMFGCLGAGVVNDRVNMQACWDAASAAGVGVHVRHRHECDGGDLTFPSGLTLRFSGEGELLHAHVLASGTPGAEITLTAAVARGATTLPLSTATIDDGDWLRVASCLSSGSTDAGVDQLHAEVGRENTLAEFVRVTDGTSSGSQATLASNLLFPYTDTPGGDSPVAWTASVARVIDFHVGGRIIGGKFTGFATGESKIFELAWCRDFEFIDGEYDTDDATGQTVRFDYCVDCHIRGGTHRGKRTAIPGGSSANQIIIARCQRVVLHGTTLEYGNQCVDLTPGVADTTYRAGPMIACGAVACAAYNPGTEGFTAHDGGYCNFFDGCTVVGAARGIRIRSRGDRVTNATVISGGAGGVGVYVANAATVDALVSGVHTEGYLWGIGYDLVEDGWDALFGLVGGTCLITNCTIRRPVLGVRLVEPVSPSATRYAPTIRNVTVSAPSSAGVSIGSYVNGATVKGCRVTGVPASGEAFAFENDIQYLTLDDNHAYEIDAAGVALQGPGTTMIADTATFPGGEASANLSLGALYTDAATPISAIPTDLSAYARPTQPKRLPLAFGSSTNLAIASGAVTITQPYHTLTAEGAAAQDDLDTINGGNEGEWLVLRQSSSAQDITFTHGVGNIVTYANRSVAMTSSQSTAVFFRISSSFWLLVACYIGDEPPFFADVTAGYSFNGDEDTLINRSATNTLGFTTGGTQRASLSNTLLTLAAGVSLDVDTTITAGGTTGAQTINKSAGSVNFGIGATSLVVTNSLVTTSSVIVATVATNDATMKTVLVVAAAGSFTLHANAAATAETRVNFWVVN